MPLAAAQAFRVPCFLSVVLAPLRRLHEHVITYYSLWMCAQTPPHLQHILPFMSGLCLASRLSLPFLPFPRITHFLFLSWPCLLSPGSCLGAPGAVHPALSHPAGQPHVGHPRPAAAALAFVILTFSNE